MKRNILSIFIAIFALLFASSCVGDLVVTPIDPNLTLPEDVLDSEEAFEQVLAKCYAGLAVSASEGPDSDPDISGIDGGFGQYMRALFYLNEVTTDEANLVWNDQTIHDLHRISWTTSDIFVTAMFSRLYYQISLCNEFIRQANASDFGDSEYMQLMIAEARALRALSYYHAIDMFGNVPFATEENSVGATGPDRIARADLYNWLVEEIAGEDGFRDDLLPASETEYGRCHQDFATILLAKIYLNSEVYTDGAVKDYDKCIEECKKIISAYPTLHSNYADLFCADNNLRTNEILFAVEQDGINTQSYGGTNFVIKSSNPSGNAAWQAALGVNDGWGGITITPEFIDLFDENDTRRLFTSGADYGDEHTYEMISDMDFTNGWCSMKFKNLKSDGSAAQAQNFPDTDYPVFRTADAYLMLAEAQIRNGGIQTDGLKAFNAVRTRAGVPTVNSVTLDDILDERGREFHFENFRRSDLIRFGKYTGSEYLWSWKGGVQEGAAVDSRYVLFPIPSTEINSNDNLIQNPGY